MAEDRTPIARIQFSDEERQALGRLVKSEWLQSRSEHVRKRATIGETRKYFTDLAIDDLETVVNWELSRLKAPKQQRTKRQPTKRDLEQVRSVVEKVEKKIIDLKQYDCLINERFGKEHRRNLFIELRHLRRALDQEIASHRTGQKKKPHVGMALVVARWMLLFEIEPKKTGNLAEVLDIVFTAGNVTDGSIRQAIDNAWDDICQPERTWPDFYEAPPDE